jgi:hypothetical protein
MFGDKLWRSLLILIPSLSHFSFFILCGVHPIYNFNPPCRSNASKPIDFKVI